MLEKTELLLERERYAVSQLSKRLLLLQEENEMIISDRKGLQADNEKLCQEKLVLTAALEDPSAFWGTDRYKELRERLFGDVNENGDC